MVRAVFMQTGFKSSSAIFLLIVDINSTSQTMFLPSSAPKSINTVQCDFYLFAEPFHVHSWKYIIYKWQQCHNIHFVII